MTAVNLDLRSALGITPPAEYEARKKPSAWKTDVNRLLQLAFHVYTAWDERLH